MTTRFIKASTLHKRALHGNPWCFLSIGLTAALQVSYVPFARACAGAGVMLFLDGSAGGNPWCFLSIGLTAPLQLS